LPYKRLPVKIRKIKYVFLETIVKNKVPAGIISLGTLFLTYFLRNLRGTYFIARISTGSQFF
jgi:hypothetical protein